MTRRDFFALSTLALAGAALRVRADTDLPLPSRPARARRVTGTVYVDVNHNGRCDAGDKPLAGVLVSDGATIVRTDALGRYQLPPSATGLLPATGSLVRMSIPSGYWPVGNRWFARVAPGDATACDFTLTPQAQPSSWSMVQVSDLHYFKPAAKQLRAFCAQVNALPTGRSALTAPAFLMATGDLVVESNAASHDAAARRLFHDYAEAVAPLHAPLFTLPGNHDLPGVVSHMAPDDPLYGKRGYEALVGPAHYSFNYGGVHILALDSNLVRPQHVRGGFSSECLAWLRADLSLTPADQPLLVFCHQQPVCWDNPADLQAALAGRKVLGLFCGHSHQSHNYAWDGSQAHEGGALCGFWWLKQCPDGKPRGFRLLQVTPEAVQTQYVHAANPPHGEFSLVCRTLEQRASRDMLMRMAARGLENL